MRVAVAIGLERLPQRVHRRSEVRELLEVQRAERLEPARALVRESQADGAQVVRVRSARDEPGSLGAIDQPDGAVVAQQEMVGDVADGRAARVGVTADGEQQLVLRGRQPGRMGLPFAPAQKPAQARAKVEEPGVLRRRRGDRQAAPLRLNLAFETHFPVSATVYQPERVLTHASPAVADRRDGRLGDGRLPADHDVVDLERHDPLAFEDLLERRLAVPEVVFVDVHPATESLAVSVPTRLLEVDERLCGGSFLRLEPVDRIFGLRIDVWATATRQGQHEQRDESAVPQHVSSPASAPSAGTGRSSVGRTTRPP